MKPWSCCTKEVTSPWHAAGLAGSRGNSADKAGRRIEQWIGQEGESRAMDQQRMGIIVMLKDSMEPGLLCSMLSRKVGPHCYISTMSCN